MEQDRLWELVAGQREPLLAWIKARLGPAARKRFDADSVFDSMVKSLCGLSQVPEGERELSRAGEQSKKSALANELQLANSRRQLASWRPVWLLA